MTETTGKPRKRPVRRPSVSRTFRFPKTVSRSALLEDGEDHRFRKLIYELGYLSELLDRARQHLAATLGLSPPQYNIVMVVAEFQQVHGVSVVDIASHLHVSGAFVTTQANTLVAKGLLEKLPNPNDGRSVLLRLTALAAAEVERVAPHIREFNDRFFASLDRERFVELCRAVSGLIGSAEGALSALSRPRNTLHTARSRD
jgi:DNA-binding MarR family transcriptional regulator